MLPDIFRNEHTFAASSARLSVPLLSGLFLSNYPRELNEASLTCGDVHFITMFRFGDFLIALLISI